MLCILYGCSNLSSIRVAEEAGLARSTISTDLFTLTTYSRILDPSKPVVFYIEGDGFAWRTRNRLSMDPTPRNLLVLRLAAIDPSPNVVYLARPCQYDGIYDEVCDGVYWSRKRFSEEVIDSMNQAITKVMSRNSSGKLHLIGYSGGGAVATLVADRRDDVFTLRTIAGNLDPDAVNKHHKVSPLNGLNPIDVAYGLRGLPQRHFIGFEDKVVPPFIVENYTEKSGSTNCIQISSIAEVGHHKGWESRWYGLLSEPVSCIPDRKE